ncbi:MAG: acetolactate synthase large subunit [Candidatus Eisenbacteria bacterium]|nr:acetolactate synthase large subunit [Candidatus Eisenbacteria bacterium]
MRAADLFVRCLEQEGVAYVFALPGEENLDLLEALRDSSIHVLVTRHEQGAAFMAATYARLTGKVGVCLSTLGPGATNLVTGVAHAQLGGIPLLAITGQKPIRQNWHADFQVIDVVDMFQSLTKRTTQIRGPLSIPKEIRHAFKLATDERQGACHIELPEDVAQEEVPAGMRPLPVGRMRRPAPDADAIVQAAEQIRQARHPILIVSSRAQRRRVHAALREFCDATNIYLIHTQLGKGALGDDHRNSLYAFGIHKHDYVNCVVDAADLIITVGYSTHEHPPRLWNDSLEKEIVHIDFVRARTETHYNPRVEVLGDIANSLDALRAALDDYEYDAAPLERTRAELHEKLFVEGATDSAFPPRPRRIVAECRRVLDHEDILCLDNGIYKLWFARHYPTYAIGTFVLDNTLATMGAGLPAAMAAKLVNPERRVLGVVGDGGFLMNSQEMETAVRLRIPVVILLLNDDGFGFIRWKQASMGYRDFGLQLGNPDFVAYARSYGAEGHRISATDELGPVLQKAFDAQKPVLIECPIDYSENITVWNQELGSVECRMD